MAAQQEVHTVQSSPWAVRLLTDEVVDFQLGQDKLAAAAAHCLASPGADRMVLQYGTCQGALVFRQQLASFLTDEYGFPVAAEELLVTAGVSHGLDLACRRLSSPGDVILIEQPTYYLVQGIFDQCGLRTVGVPTDDDGIVVEELEQMLEADPGLKPRLLYCIPTHNNPRGTTIPLLRRQALLRLAHRHGFTILADEVYQCLTFPGALQPPPPLRHVEAAMVEGRGSETRVVSLSSFSKTMAAPGLRLGWIEASAPLVAELSKCAVLRSGGSLNQLTAGIMLSAMQLGLLHEHLHGHVRPLLADNCAALCDALRTALPHCRFLAPQGGYFVWLELPPGVDAARLLERAGPQHGVKFVPGPVCQGAPHCVRLAFSFYPADELREGVARLAAALEDYKKDSQPQAR